MQKINRNVKIAKYGICEWCFSPTIHKKLIKCSNPKCKILICKSCQTMIENKPFCHECVVEFVRHKSLFIVTK